MTPSHDIEKSNKKELYTLKLGHIWFYSIDKAKLFAKSIYEYSSRWCGYDRAGNGTN